MPRRDDASRDMLFGLLAVQNALINRTQLAAAMDVWARDTSQPIAQILVEQGALDERGVASLEQLLAEHPRMRPGKARRAAQGRPPTAGAPTVRPSKDDSPATVAYVGRVAPVLPTDPEAASHEAARQRFRILKHHARG